VTDDRDALLARYPVETRRLCEASKAITAARRALIAALMAALTADAALLRAMRNETGPISPRFLGDMAFSANLMFQELGLQPPWNPVRPGSPETMADAIERLLGEVEALRAKWQTP
jgi:hypothetical protein